MRESITHCPNRAGWIAWAAWCLAAVCGSCWIAFGPARQPANQFYGQAAQRFLAGEDLYDHSGAGFLYLPHAALFYAPLTALPREAEQIVWRCLGVALVTAGLWQTGQLAGARSASAGFVAMTLFTLPKALTCILNGQATLAMAGLMMLCLSAAAQQRWWRAALLAVLALGVKPLAVVLVLLLWPLYRPLWIRMPVVLAIFASVPLAAGGAQYGMHQYTGFVEMLRPAAALGQTGGWPQAFGLAELLGLEFAPGWQWAARLAFAAATLAAAFAARNCTGGGRFEPRLYSLAACYLLLFNPRTENNSYVMLAPVLGALWLGSRGEAARLRAILVALGVINVAGHELCGAVTPSAGFAWTGPLAALCCLPLMARAWRGREWVRESSARARPTWRQAAVAWLSW